jgi:hypothetical protein
MSRLRLQAISKNSQGLWPFKWLQRISVTVPGSSLGKPATSIFKNPLKEPTGARGLQGTHGIVVQGSFREALAYTKCRLRKRYQNEGPATTRYDTHKVRRGLRKQCKNKKRHDTTHTHTQNDQQRKTLLKWCISCACHTQNGRAQVLPRFARACAVKNARGSIEGNFCQGLIETVGTRDTTTHVNPRSTLASNN